jgi:trans-2,3-dihydro-3-hydroxyanthranilate isomerase
VPSLHYEVVDVFATQAFAGNPLAVVLDADDLSTAALQSLAREFNLSETAFPLVPDVPGADYRLRIFTPHAELPFAGHPSVGTVWVLAWLGRIGWPGVVTQSCGAGQLRLRVAAAGSGFPGRPGRVELTGGPPTVGPVLDAAALLAAVGLSPNDLAGPPPRICSTGLAFGYLAVRPDAVARARPDVAGLCALAAQGIEGGVSVSAWDGARAHTRVFAGAVGVPEDPATGSAALGYGAWLAASGLVAADAETAYVVIQGAELGRPSRIEGTVVTAAGRAVECRVAGEVVPVATGEIARPPAG